MAKTISEFKYNEHTRTINRLSSITREMIELPDNLFKHGNLSKWNKIHKIQKKKSKLMKACRKYLKHHKKKNKGRGNEYEN